MRLCAADLYSLAECTIKHAIVLTSDIISFKAFYGEIKIDRPSVLRCQTRQYPNEILNRNVFTAITAVTLVLISS